LAKADGRKVSSGHRRLLKYSAYLRMEFISEVIVTAGKNTGPIATKLHYDKLLKFYFSKYIIGAFK
jgi:hypothetical protein